MSPESRATGTGHSLPWYLWGVVAAATSYVVGFYWDISWHQTIGRDSFWNPAHMAIYSCGILGGLSCGYLILSTTFGKRQDLRDASVKVWGFRAPLGAFVVAWGGAVMLTSAPFDNWWHGAYGLDATLNSPPHWVLTTGVFAVQVGGMVLLAGTLNRDGDAGRQKLTWLLIYMGATVIALPLVLANNRTLYHSAICYAGVAATVPVVMIAAAQASGRRWACTIMAAIYMSYVLAFLWVLPWFPGSPRLGPVYQDVTHFVPPGFPLLLIVPASLMDLLRMRWHPRNAWLESLALGCVFVLTLMAAQWPFADFLMSPLSHNWIFGSQYLPYFAKPASNLATGRYHIEHPSTFWLVMMAALGTAVIGSRVGLGLGSWLRRVYR